MQIAINTNINSRQQPVKAATVKLSVKQTTRFNEGKSENGTHRSIRKSHDANYEETPERGLDPEFLKFCSSMQKADPAIYESKQSFGAPTQVPFL